MKKIKIGLPLLAMVLAVAASAFTTSNESALSEDVAWFQFTGQPGEENLAEKYVMITTPTCDVVDDNRCEILTQKQARPNDHLPDLSAPIQEERFKP